VIELRGVSKYYPQGFQKTWVLRHVDLAVEQGEFVTVTGPSGSGKSTLLHLLGLLDEPSGGEYFFEGVPVHTLGERQRTALHREKIGFVFQAYHLLDDLTVYENLETPLLYQKVPADERKARVAEMLDRFGMVAKKDLFPGQLSGGQQQLVGVARALIIRPSLILADEPTGNLHSSQGETVMEAFRELNERDGVTVIQVTHSERFAAYGLRTVELLDGGVVSDRLSRSSGEAISTAVA
jgi:ABC-type lipoprotein export system ATPase subunit